MIETVILRQFNKYSDECDAPIELYPARKKSLRILANFVVDHFQFEVMVSDSNCTTVAIELNSGAEAFELTSKSENRHYFCSQKIKSNGFLRYNLGLYRLSAVVDEQEFPLTAINATVEFDPKLLESIYDYVDRSEIFSAYIAAYTRSNRATIREESERHSYTVWRLLNTTGLYMTAVRSLVAERTRSFSRIENKEELLSWSENVALLPEDLDWLVSHGPKFSLSQGGPIRSQGFRFSPDVVRQTKQIDSGNSAENCLLNFIFESMRHTLAEVALHHAKDPFGAVSKQIIQLEAAHLKFMQATGCRSSKFTPPSLSSFAVSKTKLSVLQAMNQWRSLLDKERQGGLSFDATPDVTEVFEYFCFSVVADSLLSLGFTLDEDPNGAMASGQTLKLFRQSTVIDLYYEPQIRPEERDVAGLFSAKFTNGKSQVPDIVARVKKGDAVVYLILDAKFAKEDHVNRSIERGGLAALLFYKYGLFLRTDQGSPVSMVCALYPGVKGFETKNFKQATASSDNGTQLISIGLPIKPRLDILELRRVGTRIFGEALRELEGSQKLSALVPNKPIVEAVRQATFVVA